MQTQPEPSATPARATADAWLNARLRASPNFSMGLTQDGRPFLAKEVEPYVQFWLSDRERQLHSAFMRRGGMRVSDAVLPLSGAKPLAPWRRTLENMIEAGVLLGVHDDSSRYTHRMARHYLAHRPVPPEVAATIARLGRLNAHSAVLDMAGGPGDLAVQLAAYSGNVQLMELSRGFLLAARRRARTLGRELQTLHESCNRLVQLDGAYDHITVCQALHWLDDVQVCRGVCRLLNPDGSFFVIHSAIEVPARHPLAHLFGHKSILGAKRKQPFALEVRPLWQRLSTLFDALDAPNVQRVDPSLAGLPAAGLDAQRIVPTDVTLFTQPRPIDIGFARAFLSDSHIAVTGMPIKAFWTDLNARCAKASSGQLAGHMHWAILHFRRGGQRLKAPAWSRMELTPIPYLPGD